MRRNVVNGMMGLCIAAAFGLAGCGGGGDGGTLAPVQTQAEIDAAKLATLKKVEGSWTFNYTGVVKLGAAFSAVPSFFFKAFKIVGASRFPHTIFFPYGVVFVPVSG